MPNINEVFPSDFLKASDLQGKELALTVAGVEFTQMQNGENKLLVHFEGRDKGLLLNKTNANNIAAAYSPETDGWVGKSVILYSAWVDFQGRSVEAIRVRPNPNGTAPAAPQQETENPVPL